MQIPEIQNLPKAILWLVQRSSNLNPVHLGLKTDPSQESVAYQGIPLVLGMA